MEVKELVEMLNKCDPEEKVVIGYEAFPGDEVNSINQCGDTVEIL